MITVSHETHYTTGEEIHVGDRILFGGYPGTVVVVIGRGEYAPEFNPEDWSDHERGLVVRTDDGQLYMYEYADEDIKLVSHGAANQARRTLKLPSK